MRWPWNRTAKGIDVGEVRLEWPPQDAPPEQLFEFGALVALVLLNMETNTSEGIDVLDRAAVAYWERWCR